MYFLRLLSVSTFLLSLVVQSAVAGVVESSQSPIGGSKLRWKETSIRIAVSRSLFLAAPNIKTGSDVAGAIRNSLNAWEAAADLELIEETSDKQSVSPAGISGDGVSLITVAATPENILLFGKGDDSAAKTRVFFNLRGFISEADIVLSPFQQFSTDGTYGTFDLETTLKHEIGHLLGLRHSSIVGSIMYDVSPRNGVFGDNAVAYRQLADADISAIRDLYGASGDPDCCGVLTGRFTGPGKDTRNIKLWLLEAESGAVAAHGSVSKEGSFRIGGLRQGTYDLTARANGYSLIRLGRVTIERNEALAIARKAPRRQRDFSVSMVGKNGIMSDSPLRLARGGTYPLFAGGKGLGLDRFRLDSDSPFLRVERDPSADISYEGGIFGLGVVVTVSPDSPSGTYNLCAESEAGVRDCMVGAIVIGD
jgi:hypothetical protein